MAVSFSCSLFNLASSSSRCLAAITASSFATSSCWARHCRSYKHIGKYTPGRNKKKKSKLLAINSCLERITHREATSWAPLPWCQNLALTSEEVSKLPFTLCDRSHHDPSNHWIIKKTCVFEPYYKLTNFLLLFSLKGFYDTNSMYKSHVNFKCGNNQILRYNALTEHWQIFLF